MESTEAPVNRYAVEYMSEADAAKLIGETALNKEKAFYGFRELRILVLREHCFVDGKLWTQFKVALLGADMAFRVYPDNHIELVKFRSE